MFPLIRNHLAALNITRIPFEMLDGNAQGYAQKRSIAINPLATLPHKTLFHEVGHVVLGHTEEGQLIDHDDNRTPRNIREVEAELAPSQPLPVTTTTSASSAVLQASIRPVRSSVISMLPPPR